MFFFQSTTSLDQSPSPPLLHKNGITMTNGGGINSGNSIKYGTLVPNRVFVGGIRYVDYSWFSHVA